MDRSSERWAAQPEVCLIWLGTLPSASGRIIEARRRLENLILGPGTLNEFMDGNPFVPPTVLHDKTGHIPDAAAVAVGVGSCATSLSPWSCPLRPEEFSTVDARRIIETRIDSRSWIARLSGKTLVCNCGCEARADCWAWVLRSTFVDWFGEEDKDDSENDDVPFEDLEAMEDDEAGEYVSYRDEINGTEMNMAVPAHVPWPAA